VVAVGCDLAGADIILAVNSDADTWVTEALSSSAASSTFGGLMLRCRQALDQGDVAQALEAVRLAEGVRPGTPQGCERHGSVRLRCRTSGGAVSFLRRAIEIDPTFRPALDNLAALG